jgi:glutamate N-acetyltransferase/amino-acid N-acetyltransferase
MAPKNYLDYSTMCASFADHERVPQVQHLKWPGIRFISPAKLNRLKPIVEISDTTELALPRGFRFGAAKAGLKKSGRPDFALIVSDAPSSAAAAFTANRVTAAPLVVDKEHLRATGGKVRVAAINAGNANCAAGQAGLDAARATCEATAQLFGCRTEEVFPSSTGIIGVPLPAEKLIAVLPGLATSLGSDFNHFQQVAQAILTTDTVEKTAFARLVIAGPNAASREVRIAALCKGSGMIHPQLVPHATMLVYILTDAAVDPAVLDGYLREAIEVSFNRISVDGDTSTNDTVLLLASGASGVAIGPGNAAFAAALTEVCTSLARQIVADGEGVMHVVELRIEGAATDTDALKIAKAIAHSPLVKTAWAGSDPNWGRLLAAIGYSGAQIDPERVDIRFGELAICHNGGRAPEFDEAAAHAYIAQPEFSITIQLHQGACSCIFWTTDLTHEYVSINADYST